MHGVRAAKGGPKLSYELPGLKAISPSDEGHFDALVSGSQLLRGGPNQFATVAWSAGSAGSFECGQGFARVARLYGKDGDEHASYRPDIEMVWCYHADWLCRFPGWENAIPPHVRHLLETHPDVLLETNDGVSVNADSAVDGGVQVIALIPDEEGAYDLDAARAKITPPESKAYALSA